MPNKYVPPKPEPLVPVFLTESLAKRFTEEIGAELLSLAESRISGRNEKIKNLEEKIEQAKLSKFAGELPEA